MTGPGRDSVDVLMITYNRPRYTRQSLTRLVETCDDSANVWIWHNGEDKATLAVVQEFAEHPRVAMFHHSRENQRLRAPTNWLWENSTADFVSKVDDDCLVPIGWLDHLRDAHRDIPDAGVLGSWRFPDEDFDPELAKSKIQDHGGHQILRNFWVEGSGYLLRRSCLDALGPLRPDESFTTWCIRAARKGWIVGWLYPFLYQEHMDDPRAEHTGLKTDEEFMKFRPLTAINLGITTVDGWADMLRNDARTIQSSSIEPGYWAPWRMKARRLALRIKR